MSAYHPTEEDREQRESQQQTGLDFYGQAAGGGEQQTNLAAVAQYNELANNPELAQLLQQEASKQAAAMGMQYGMMGGPMMGLNGGMYRMPPEMMQMPAGVGMMAEEEPLYVNAKQYNRILKRRQARAKLEAIMRASKASSGGADKAPYMHESRHRHAMKRPRGPGGRFLTAPEIAALKAKEAAEGKGDAESSGSSTTSAEPNKQAKQAKA